MPDPRLDLPLSWKVKGGAPGARHPPSPQILQHATDRDADWEAAD
jgi:hypothetical protein